MTANGAPVRILLLEDSDIDAELIERQLAHLGVDVDVQRATVRRDYEIALAKARFDLVISDYSVPGFDGVEALELARGLDPHVPFLFVSGVVGEHFATEALRAGATDYVTKRDLLRIPAVANRALVEAAERRERLRAVEALKESESRFRHMANSAPALIWEVDDKASVSFVNDRFEAEFGISPAGMISDGWRTFVHPVDWQAFEGDRRRRFERREPFSGIIRVRARSGETRWIRAESHPRHGVNGSFLGYIGCAVDITDTKLARDALEAEVQARTEQLRINEEALRQANKMEAIGQLTGGIAHDFNNMLAGIIGSAELLRRRLHAGRYDDCDRHVDALIGSANRAAGLTQQLLAFSRRQTLDVKPVRVDEHIATLGDMLRRMIGPGIELATIAAPGLWLASSDANQLESAIINLSINARDAMPNGGQLRIDASNVRLPAPATPEQPAAGEYVRIGITDTGTGMDDDTLAKAIDPFFTTKPIGQGTGLGLSMVYGFIAQTGGHLGIRSQLGVGTTVELHLPRARDASVPIEEPADDLPPSAAACGSVFVVEDEDTIRDLVVDYLRDLGYDVAHADSAEAALNVLGSRDVDMLLTDVGLPGMNGKQLAVEARRLQPDLAVLFATGYADGAAARSDLVDGEHMDMIFKPFRLAALADKVASVMQRAHAARGMRGVRLD